MNLEANKQNAISYYRMAYEGNPAQAVADFVGDEYIQHNPSVPDGTQGFINYFEQMQREYPNKSIDFVRAVAEGDLVALHTHQTWHEGEEINEYITMDFFRFDDNGKIVEHWDSIQKIPEHSENQNKMY